MAWKTTAYSPKRVGKTHAAKRDERLRRVFTDKPSAVKHVLNRMVALHKEAITEGEVVFQHNADPMISIAAKSSKFGGFTEKQGTYVLDVITDHVHAKIAWAVLAEVDPVAWEAASKLGADGMPIPVKPEKPAPLRAPLYPEEEDIDLEDMAPEVDLDDEPELTVADRPANWGMF